MPRQVGGGNVSNWKSPALLEQLQPLETDLALLPCDGNKKPLLKQWPKHAGFSVADLVAYPGIRAIGARTGVNTGPLVCFDFDGPSALTFGKTHGLVPSCRSLATWQVHRSNNPHRLKVLFKPTPEQIAQLPNGAHGLEFQGKTATGDGEALEVFFAGGRQVIVLGDHPDGGQYSWPFEQGPEALTAPPQAWWEHAISIASKNKATQRSKAVTSSGDWRKQIRCDVCGRNQRQVCSIHRDGNTIRCFYGSSFSPPENLHRGQRIGAGTWAFSKDQDVPGIGTFAVFVRHKPSVLDGIWTQLAAGGWHG